MEYCTWIGAVHVEFLKWEFLILPGKFYLCFVKSVFARRG